jgi:hypothetical protein
MMVGHGLVTVFVWIFYFGLTSLVIFLDHRRQVELAERRGQLDFSSPNIGLYLLLGLLFGPIPLIVYFGLSRKSFGGWVLGFVFSAGVLLATFVAYFGVAVLLRSFA